MAIRQRMPCHRAAHDTEAVRHRPARHPRFRVPRPGIGQHQRGKRLLGPSHSPQPGKLSAAIHASYAAATSFPETSRARGASSGRAG